MVSSLIYRSLISGAFYKSLYVFMTHSMSKNIPQFSSHPASSERRFPRNLQFGTVVRQVGPAVSAVPIAILCERFYNCLTVFRLQRLVSGSFFYISTENQTE